LTKANDVDKWVETILLMWTAVKKATGVEASSK